MNNDKKNTFRIDKVNSKIQIELGEILHEFLSGENGLVTISRVETSQDMKWAKIFISIFAPNQPSSGLQPPSPKGGREISPSQPKAAQTFDDKILKLINSNIYDIQGQLNAKFATKIVPRLSFYLDTTPRYVQHIDEVIKKIHEEQ